MNTQNNGVVAVIARMKWFFLALGAFFTYIEFNRKNLLLELNFKLARTWFALSPLNGSEMTTILACHTRGAGFWLTPKREGLRQA